MEVYIDTTRFKFCTPSKGVMQPIDKPFFIYGDNGTLTIKMLNASGQIITPDETLTYVLYGKKDKDMDSAVMIYCESPTVDVINRSVTFTFSTDTPGFLEATDGVTAQRPMFIRIESIPAGESATTTILEDYCYARGSVYAGPVVDEPQTQYTKAQVDSLNMTIRTELQDAKNSALQSAIEASVHADDAEAAKILAVEAKKDLEIARDAAIIAQENAEQAESNAEYAETKAEMAQGKAEEAQVKSETAQSKAEEAQGKAEEALDKAEMAQGKAEEAQSKAETAQIKAETAQNKAEEALGKAETAQGNAEQAETNAELAETNAETAQGKAEDAQANAETARGNAEVAQGKAETAQSKAEEAQGKAETAVTNAETAQSKAEEAQGKAEIAVTNAETAQSKAEEAQGKAEIAQGKAEEAQGKAEIAQGKAELAQTNAEIVQANIEQAQVVVNSLVETATTQANLAANAATNASNYASNAESFSSNAYASATSASESLTSAIAQVENARIWTEGSDAEVAGLGGEKSAKTFAAQAQAVYDSIQAYNTIPVGPVTNFGMLRRTGSLDICWTDPDDVVINGRTLAKWGMTRLLVKIGSYPSTPEDGRILANNTVKNAYSSIPYTWETSIDTDFRFALFTCSQSGAWNVEEAVMFTWRDLTLTTIGMAIRNGTVREYLSVGDVLGMQVHEEFPDMRMQVMHIDYTGCRMQNGSLTHNIIVKPSKIPTYNYGTTENFIHPLDVAENAWARTDDAIFYPNKTYGKLQAGVYVTLVAGTDYEYGDSIATFGEPVYEGNSSNRARYGSNRMSQSNIHNYANASGYNWFRPMNKWDVCGTGYSTKRGFLSGLVPEFASLVQPMYRIAARETLDGGESEEFLAKFWLMSLAEFNGSACKGIYEGSQFDYYQSIAITNEQRKMYDENNVARSWWLGSIGINGNNGNAYSVTNAGGTTVASCSASNGIVLACALG